MSEAHCGDTKKRLAEFAGMGVETLAIHGGQVPDPVTGAIMPAIYQTSTYVQKSPGKTVAGYEYTRTHNPTRRMLEDCVALLEGGTWGLATASGMAAIDLVLNLLKQGDQVICGDDVYGGTYRLLTTVSTRRGIDTQFVDMGSVAAIEKVATAKTKLVWLETPTNPLLKLIDIAAVADLCRSKGWILVVDNTFATPIFQKPLALGADIVIHSMTKYMNGHSDVVAGCVVTSREDLASELYRLQNSIGLVMGPMESWLVLRGIKTLAVRMHAHQQHAMSVARFLEEHPKVERVVYPGLESHPQHALAKKQMSGFSGMISFYVKGGLEDCRRVLERVKIFSLAESLGGVESLIEHPAIMTHASVPREMREKTGIFDNFIRLSVGLESLNDLTKDLDQALR